MGGSLPELTQKEIFLIDQLAVSSGASSQRELAKNAGFSIGLLNILLRRLISRGYVKTKSLNKRKIRYLLTSKGIRQSLKRAYQLTLNTIRSYGEIEGRISTIIRQNLEDGYSRFVLVGNGEIANLVRRVVDNHYKGMAQICDQPPEEQQYVILNLQDTLSPKKGRTINVFDQISRS